jgi:hypothetical protein
MQLPIRYKEEEGPAVLALPIVQKLPINFAVLSGKIKLRKIDEDKIKI